MRAIDAHPDLMLQVVAGGSMVLERFSRPVRMLWEDGFRVDGEAYVELEGSTPATMAKSVGLGIMEFSSQFQRLAPDFVLLIGDRYEALSAAIAAAYMNLCIAHVQGGEVSGSIDESASHAITKFAHYHFPSTQRSAEYVISMGEDPTTVLTVGCPGSDIARQLDRQLPSHVVNSRGSGALIDVAKPFLLVVFHPTTTEYGGERGQMEELLGALARLKMQTVLFWPNIDAGADHLSKAIRQFRAEVGADWLRTLINLSPEDYLRVLSNASCAIGNSSSFVRDASYFGTPVVLVGDRQEGRETDEHVTHVETRSNDIERAIRVQLAHGRYAPSSLYGDGGTAQRITDALARVRPYVQKRLHYIYNGAGNSSKGNGQTRDIQRCVFSE
jgi:UDP-hydrolysing UDP-N-acetyl-D-glucosamine 2-epimerase